MLVLTETAGFVHPSIADGVAFMRDLDRRDPRVNVVVVADGGELSRARLARAEALMFLNTSGEVPLSGRQQTAIERFVARGGGLIGTHSASDTFHSTWPAYKRLLGAEFDHHGPIEEGQVVVADRRHPAMRRLPARFSLREEYYRFKAPPRRAHVLAEQAAPDGRHPLVWCRAEGRGRVFYDALGHEPATWRDARHKRLLGDGVRWALGLLRGGSCKAQGASP